MPNTRRLTELFRAIGGENLTQAGDLAAAICRDEAKKGHHAAARRLKGALSAHQMNGASLNGHSTLSTFPGQALSRLTTDVRIDDVVLEPSARSHLAEVLAEWKHRDRLLKRKIPPRSKLLFFGPPGCGKSLTARAIGAELGLPVYVVRFDAVIGAYLGQTAIHLRQLFSFAEHTACVLLLDEIDALGKRRGNPLDVGELDRIVISLMQELEHSTPRGLIIATSNLPKHLDAALWRRFDLNLEFKAPTRRTLQTYAVSTAKSLRIKLPQKVQQQSAAQSSFATARAVVLNEARRQALRG